MDPTLPLLPALKFPVPILNKIAISFFITKTALKIAKRYLKIINKYEMNAEILSIGLAEKLNL